MTNLMQASRQWATRPADQRFVTLDALMAKVSADTSASRAYNVSSRALKALPMDLGGQHGARALVIASKDGPADILAPTHWSFGQAAKLAGAPASYLRDLPAPIAADCINWGLAKRQVEDVALYAQDISEGAGTAWTMRAATGPKYGRIYNRDVVQAVMDLGGPWQVPSEFNRPTQITIENTTLYASDRDCFMFLVDESAPIVVGKLPASQGGGDDVLYRGFFSWNSEVGCTSFGLMTFLYRYICSNRIVWGAQDVTELRMKHSSGAPDRWLEEARPALESYSKGEAASIVAGVKLAKAATIAGGDEEKIFDFLADRFGARDTKSMLEQYEAEEGGKVRSIWDATQAATGYARNIKNQGDRVDFERQAGKLMAAA